MVFAPSVSEPYPLGGGVATSKSKKAQASKVVAAPKAAHAKAAKAPPAKSHAKAAPAPAKAAPPPKSAPAKAAVAAEPAKKPGAPALRAPARTPERAEELKAKIGALATATGQIRALKRSLHKSFHDVGQLLREIQVRKLYEVKGYGSFEAFLEREIDLGKQLSLRILKISQIFQRDAAVAYGLDRAIAALAALEGEPEAQAATPAPAPTAAGTRSPIPPHKQ